MLALAWPWGDGAQDHKKDFSKLLANSLCAGIGGHAGRASLDGIYFACRCLRSSAAQSRLWRPALLPSGQIAVFHGYFDNAPAIADELRGDARDLAALYGLAVERWGDEADRNIIGEYCAIIATPEQRRLRLSRSPIRAPPLCYFHDENLTAAASVPRALFAAGVEQRLNETRLADSSLLNFTDPEMGWFIGVSRVPSGSIIELTNGKPRALRNYYDVLTIPAVEAANDADLLARASELLNEGVKACLKGFEVPGATISGGLDSPQVAARVLDHLPASQSLPTFTFHPEKGFDGLIEPWLFADDRPFVEEFVRMHPRLEPHFTTNEGYEHDYRWNDFFHLMGGAPSGLCNMYVLHGLFRGAARRGCDVLFLCDWGNETFSADGSWGFIEYLLTGRLRQYWQAVAGLPDASGSIIRRIIARTVLPVLPRWMWRLARKLAFPNRRSVVDLISPLTLGYRQKSGAQARLQSSRFQFDQYGPRNRKHARKLVSDLGDFEVDEMYQAFEQMYGVAQRDPTAYRPFVEFCHGLPTKMFLRDGQMRWLARQLARGIMPERQRLNPLHGRWDSDWHLRMSRRRHDYIAELDRLSENERVAAIIDIPRLRSALEDWPNQTVVDQQQSVPREGAVPRGLLAARFINYVEGRNES